MSNTSLLSAFLSVNPTPPSNEDTPSVIDPLDEVIAVNPPEAHYDAPVVEQRTDAAPAPDMTFALVDSAPAPSVEKPKRGRPKKAVEPVAAVPPVALSLSTETKAFLKSLSLSQVTAKIATLYLNSMPFGVEAIYFDMFFATIENRYFDQTKIEDYRLADFGKGKVEIARLIREAVETGELSGHVVVDIHGDSGRLAAQTLAPFAALIVRGF